MVLQKLYKTKLCVLYQKGVCPHQSCSFAHGNAELRRFSGSFNGRRNFRSSELRDKINRRSSPLRRYSPRRDARGRHASHGHSPPRSLGKRSDRKPRKKQYLDSQSDFSGSLKASDATGDRVKDKRITSSDSKNILEEQLRQVQSDVEMLDDHKCQLEIYLDERLQEADSLTCKIQELDMQLCKEKEECKRIASKIKKFVKAHNRYVRIQDELKRSQTRLQKVGDQLASDVTRLGTNEEDSSINILSDGETTGYQVTSPRNEVQKNAFPSKKRLRVNLEAAEGSKYDLTKGEGITLGTIGLQKFSRWSTHNTQSNNSREAEVEYNGNNCSKTLVNEDKRKWAKNIAIGVRSADKLKGSESGFMLPSTGMAAHAGDEVAETIEREEKFEVVETAPTGAEGAASEVPALFMPLPPPPPPIPQNAYTEYEGGDGNVDLERLEEMVDVEIV